MGDVITYAIELAVGVASLILGAVVGRSSGPRWLAATLVVAGAAACTHAVMELAG